MNCIFCSLIENKGNETLIFQRPNGSVFLNHDQFFYGRVLYVLNGHWTDISEVPSDVFDETSRDMHILTKAIKHFTKADLVNVASLGNYVQHVHWHIIPRYKHEPLWGKPPWPHGENILNKLGKQDESPFELAQRLLPLLEAIPIYNFSLCNKITDDILHRYMELHRDKPEKEAVILLNDLIRFFRYICANYQYKSWHDGEKWVLRNVKLRHSRVIMYAGLLLVILNASKSEYRLEKEKYIKSMLGYTPIERIMRVMKENGNNLDPFLSSYNYFLGMINQESMRAKMFNIDYSEREKNALHNKFSRNAAFLQELLMNFVFSMREKGVWSSKALGYLLF